MNPFLGQYRIIRGTTNGTANTQMSTQPVNPFKHTGIYVIPLAGCVYVFHDPSSPSTATRASGITDSTIDIRSTKTSEDFICAVWEAHDTPMV